MAINPRKIHQDALHQCLTTVKTGAVVHVMPDFNPNHIWIWQDIEILGFGFTHLITKKPMNIFFIYNGPGYILLEPFGVRLCRGSHCAVHMSKLQHYSPWPPQI